MATTTWKDIERKVAAVLEGRRVPCSGNGSIKGDVIQLRLVPGTVAEVKHGKQVLKAGPKKLSGWLQEAERDSQKAGTTGGILVLHPERKNIKDSLVVMRLGLLSSAQRALREQAPLFTEEKDE